MDLVVNPSGKLSGRIEPPPSKFYTQFATALALLAEGKSVIKDPLRVDDTRALLRAVEHLGAAVKRTPGRWTIWGVGRALQPAGNFIDLKNSATALGLMTSTATLVQRIMVVTGDPQLRSRHMPTLLRGLRRLGADVHSAKSDDSPPFVVFVGGLKGGKISLREGTNPDHLPALLLAAPYAKKGVEFKLIPNLWSARLEGAIELMKVARAKLAVTKSKLRVKADPYKSFSAQIPPDFAGTMPFITAAVLTGSKLRVSRTKGTKGEASVEPLKRLGANIRLTRGSLRVAPTDRLKGTKVDLGGAPELLPFVAALACRAKGKTTISNAARARNMKSDRIKAMAGGLRRMGVKVAERRDGMVIKGPAELEARAVDGHDDCAVVAAITALGLVAKGKTTIRNRAEALRTSYPRFVSTFQDLGADVGYSA